MEHILGRAPACHEILQAVCLLGLMIIKHQCHHAAGVYLSPLTLIGVDIGLPDLSI